jgi:hypothetical protein
MAYTDIQLQMLVTEASDCSDFLIEDDNTDWLIYDPTDPADVTVARLTVISDYGTKVFNILTAGGSRANWNLFLSSSGLAVTLTNLDITDEFFADDYYQVKLEISNADWGAGDVVSCTNQEAFLNFARCKARKVAANLNDVDLLDSDNPIDYYMENYESFLLFMMFEGAVRQAEQGQMSEFDETIAWINAYFDKYEITDCF